MEMSSPIVQLALLESLKADKFVDEIDLFLPFIAVTLSNLDTLKFTPEILQQELEKSFGFKPPISAVQVFITRAKKRKLLHRENNTFIPNIDEINKWKNSYHDKKDDVTTSLEILRRDFASFAFSKFDKELSVDECDSLIMQFVDKNISSVTDNKRFAKNELREKIKNTDHVTASFISHIHRNKTAALDHFARIVKGILLANYLCFADKIGQKKSYKSITVYIDTPIIVGLLGFNGTQKQNSLEEFTSLLTNVGINICVFDKTMDEIERLLCAWRDDLKRRNYKRFNSKTLELLRHLGYDAERLDTEIKLLKNSVEKLGVNIKYGFKIKSKFQCDENALEDAISPNFNESKNLEHDTICISRIYNMREGVLVKDLNQAFTVFVTPNTGLVSVANKFFMDEIPEKFIPLVVSEQWMTAMFWLKSPELFGSLPMDQVVSSAYGLLYKDDNFWASFIKKLESLEKKGAITEADLIQVRWDSDLLNMVHDVSVDVGEDFSEEDIFEIVDSIKKKNIAEKDKEIEDIKKEKDSEIAALKERNDSEILRVQGDFDINQQKLVRLEAKHKKMADIIALVFAILVSIIVLISVGLTTFISLPAEVIPKTITEPYAEYWLKGVAAIITIVLALLGNFFGINLLSIFKWIKNKTSHKIFISLQDG